MKKSEKLDKAEKASDGVENDLVLCMITKDMVITQKKKRVSFANNVKCSKILCAALLSTSGETHIISIEIHSSCSQNVHGLETMVISLTSPTMT